MQRHQPKRDEVSVAVGIFLRHGRVLVTRRPEGAHLAGTWEFPGGKIRPGETPEAALRREIEEEVGVAFEKAVLFHHQHHLYPERAVNLHFFLCLSGASDEPVPETDTARWVLPDALAGLPTPAANAEVIRMLREQIA